MHSKYNDNNHEFYMGKIRQIKTKFSDVVGDREFRN
jgi:hypothetical protein